MKFNLKNIRKMRVNHFFIIFLSLNAVITTCLKQLTIDEICFKEKDCISKQKIPIRTKNQDSKLFRITECKCRGKFKHRCGENFCAKRKCGCSEDDLKSLKINGTMIFGIKKCDSHNVK
jgi:hypothetical protein